MKSRMLLGALASFGAVAAACSSMSSSDDESSTGLARAIAAIGDPLAGLAADESERFREGQGEFSESETREEGLGPIFNDRSCGACHSVPVVGGGSARIETRFGGVRDGLFDPLSDLGGSLIQDQGIGIFESCSFGAEVVPAAATVRAGRRTTPLFGLGLVDAIPDETFRALAASEARESPTTAGTVSVVTEIATGLQKVGKFGWKAQNPSLAQFSADAYLNEMGITSPTFPSESCPGGNCRAVDVDAGGCNPAPGLNDPDGAAVNAFADFMSFLAPPPRAPLAPSDKEGETRFDKIGCTHCHTATLRTGAVTMAAALANVDIHPYSDFLLHDMGALGDGITQGNAGGTQMRTAPLWGLQYVTVFLHDGRAKTLADAILAHEGQGRAARDAYVALPQEQKNKVLAFLKSL